MNRQWCKTSWFLKSLNYSRKIKHDDDESEVEVVRKEDNVHLMSIKTTTKNDTKMIGDESIFWFGFLVIGMGDVVKKNNNA